MIDIILYVIYIPCTQTSGCSFHCIEVITCIGLFQCFSSRFVVSFMIHSLSFFQPRASVCNFLEHYILSTNEIERERKDEEKKYTHTPTHPNRKKRCIYIFCHKR